MFKVTLGQLGSNEALNGHKQMKSSHLVVRCQPQLSCMQQMGLRRLTSQSNVSREIVRGFLLLPTNLTGRSI